MKNKELTPAQAKLLICDLEDADLEMKSHVKVIVQGHAKITGFSEKEICKEIFTFLALGWISINRTAEEILKDKLVKIFEFSTTEKIGKARAAIAKAEGKSV